MAASGPTSLPPVYTPTVPSQTLLAANHGTVLHPNIQDELRALWLSVWASDISLIVNGNMDVWQRVGAGVQTSTTTFSATTSFAADRMFVRPAGASVTVQRTTAVPDFHSEFALQVSGAASVTTVDVGQRIPAATVARRGHQSQAFSCWLYNSSGSPFAPLLRANTPSVTDNYTTNTNRLSTSLQTCANAQWTQLSGVFDPSAYTNIANGLEVYIQIPSGSLTAGKFIYVSQFDVRPGNPSTLVLPYLPPDRELEKLKAMAYYWKTYDADTAPGTATQLGWIYAYVDVLSSSANRGNLTQVRLPVEMRAIPSITIYDAAGTSGKVTMAGGNNFASIVGDIGRRGFRAGSIDTTALTISLVGFHGVANAEIT